MGGFNTELSGPTLPEGLSPDCQDVAFVPGNVYTRPAAQRLLPSGFFSSTAVTYNKSFVQPDGSPINLFLTSDGTMSAGAPNATPSPIFQTIKGVYASSVTSFGREYIAIHDGLNGKDIPRSFDGTNVRRISQNGPGAPASISDAPTTTLPINTITPIAPVLIVTATNVAGVVTISTATPHGLVVGNDVLITGVSVNQYNGQAAVATVPDPSSFTYNALSSGWGTGAGGEVIPLEVTVDLATNGDLIAGETIVISGDSNPNYNNGNNSIVAPSISNIYMEFFYHNHTNKVGAVDLSHGSVPSPTATYTATGNQTLMINPYPSGVLPGAPSNAVSNAPARIFGVNSDGNWDGTSEVIWGSAVNDWQAITTFNLQFPVAGTYTFRVTAQQGTIFGMGGGATPVSGPMAFQYSPAQTVTPGQGYPIFTAQNTSYGDGVSLDYNFSISVPAAGVYPCELDYARWYHSPGAHLTLSWVDGSSVSHPLTTGAAYDTPPTWTVKKVLSPSSFTFDAVYAIGGGVGGTVTIGGLTSPGAHSGVVFFQTDTGYLTKPSQPFTWNSAGSKRIQVDNLPIGSSNVVARWCAFTGANGANYFAIPVPAIDPTTGLAVSSSTVVNDNTSTSATFDFSDNTLFEGLAIDITGNNLFALTTLGTPSGIFSYSNRLVVWGDTNKIQNLWNMGFEGGVPSVGDTSTPLGWDVSANVGGSLVAGDFGLGWQITGTGTITPRGQISQPAFKDYLYVPILSPTTQYTFTCYAYSSQVNTVGNLVMQFFSPTMGTIATATIPCNTLGVGQGNASFVSADFNTKTPTTIPDDTVLQVFSAGLGNGQSITIDELMVVFTDQPTVPGQARVSYALNPESFDGVTGLIGIEYPETLMSCNIIRDNLYMLSQGHLLRTQDNGIGEPTTWTIYTVAEEVRGLSVRSFDVGEGWGMFATEAGLYAFSGGEPQKISQEIQTLWSSIDQSLLAHVWVKNDLATRRIYIGVPLTEYTPTGAMFTPGSCNKVLVIDYRELNTAAMVENAPPLHISMTGRMLSSDLTRKWTIWNLPMNCCESLYVGDTYLPCFGSGDGNGLTSGFGNSYYLVGDNADPSERTKFSDDDYGQIGSYNGEGITHANGTWRPKAAYYVTYFSPSHEQEQSLQIGSQRKLYEYLEGYVVGKGNFFVVPLMDRLGNPVARPPKARTLKLNPNHDLEWPLNVRSQRMALLMYALPENL